MEKYPEKSGYFRVCLEIRGDLIAYSYHQLEQCHCMKSAKECLYLGSEWILYAGIDSNYTSAEMITPCVFLGAPGTTLSITLNNGLCIAAPCLLHAPGLRSSGIGSGALYLHFDPLSQEGLAIQSASACSHGVIEWPIPDLPEWTNTLFDELCCGTVVKERVLALINSCKEGLRISLPTAPATDPRLCRVAAMIAEQPNGRLDLATLSNAVHLSKDHLRQSFKQATGITLSRYQMWQRFNTMLRFACETSEQMSVEDIVFDGGFYDRSHGSRAIRRFFGISAANVTGTSICYRDCRD